MLNYMYNKYLTGGTGFQYPLIASDNLYLVLIIVAETIRH